MILFFKHLQCLDLYASLTPKMTVVERAKNMFSSFFMHNLIHRPLLSAIEEVAREFVDPNFDFLVSKFIFEICNWLFQEKAGTASVVFVNTDELLDFGRPITHKGKTCSFLTSSHLCLVIYIGGLVGLSEKKTKRLPEVSA